MKDPAFLFYSADFYEGTRTMLPEERACYVDLLIYQHQHGIIPKDIKRVLLYCNGIDKATLEATLEAKFKQTESGWINERLQETIEERKEYSENQSKNGVIGQFWKKAKAILCRKDYETLRNSLYYYSKEKLFEEIKNKEISEATLQAMLKASLKHLGNGNEDGNEDVIVNKDINSNLSIIEIKKGKEKNKTEFDFKKSLVELGIEDQILKDWLLVRKQKKAANTETAFKAIKNQIEISGLTANECIKLAVEKSWQGFRAEWVNNPLLVQKKTNTIQSRYHSDNPDDFEERMMAQTKR